MKKHFVYMMIFGLLLTGCGSKTDVLEPNPNQQEIEQENTEQTMEDENKDSQDTVDDINVSLLSLQKETICYEEWGNLGVICQAARDVIHLENETKKVYPELSTALDDLRNEKLEEMDTFMSNFLEQAEEEDGVNEEFYGYTSKCEFFVQRADDQILSIRETYYEYNGGARPMSGNFGENYDSVTGKELLITDVVKDMSELIRLLDEKLLEKYGEEAFYDSPKEMMEECSPEYFQWTLSYQGLSVYFSSMDVGAYGINQHMITIGFDENPELFVEKYVVQPETDYVMSVPANEEITINIKPGDGEKDTLRLWNESEDLYSKLVFQINGQDYYSDETYLISEDAYYLVCLKNGNKEKYYVYAQLGYELYQQIQVYELTENGVNYQGGLEHTYVPEEWNSETESYFMDVFNDPSEFELYSRTDWVGVVTGVRTYRADWENPVPKALTDDYDISNEWYTLTLKRTMEFEILPDGNIEEIPAGTTFQYLRTDNETYVDLLMQDGRECRVYTENWDGEAGIQGYYPDLCFDGLPNGF